jgi:hypothetical protein
MWNLRFQSIARIDTRSLAARPGQRSRHSDSVVTGQSGKCIPSTPAPRPTQPSVKSVPRVFPRSKAAWAWRSAPTTSSTEVKERILLYLYSPSGPSWPVIGWNLPKLFLQGLWDNTLSFWVNRTGRFAGSWCLLIQDQAVQEESKKSIRGLIDSEKGITIFRDFGNLLKDTV